MPVSEIKEGYLVDCFRVDVILFPLSAFPGKAGFHHDLQNMIIQTFKSVDCFQETGILQCIPGIWPFNAENWKGQE